MYSFSIGFCSICFEDLRQSDKVSAIVCGHIYHHGCISQWMAAKKQCPSCRRSVPKNGFVEKLFFDVQRMSGEADKSSTTDYREEHYKLLTKLKVEQEKSGKLDEENTSLKTEVKSLEKKILREKDKYRTEVPKLQATINHLQISTEETESLKRDLTEVKCKLRASEFYKILNTHNAEAEKQIGEYLRKGGNLDTEKFFQLQKSQIKELTEKRRDAAKEIENLKKENQELKRRQRSDAVLIQTFKKSYLETRERADINTPITNKRIRQVLDEETPSNAKRKSLGFDVSSPAMRDAELSFFKQQDNQTPNAPSTSKPATFSDFKFSLDNDDDDAEYFKTPKITIEKKKIAPLTRVSNDDSFELDIDVPPNIMNRMPPKIPSFKKSQSITERNKRPMETAAKKNTTKENSFKSVIPPPTSKSSSQNFTSSKTVTNLKRHQSTDHIPSLVPKKTVPPVKTSRISSFFQRQNSASSISGSKKEYVTLD